jgi:hypothetical protein
MSGFMKITKLDFITMKSQFWAYLSLLAIIILFWTMNSDVVVLCISGAWFAALMAINIFSIQEKNGLDRLYGSISVTLEDIVLGRYIFMFLNYLASFFFIIILYIGVGIFLKDIIDISKVITGFSISLVVFSAIIGVQMPMFFKLGYTKARIWSMIPFIVVLAMTVIIQSLAFTQFSAVIAFVQSHESVLIIGCILSGVIIQFLSYRIAVVAYRKRKRG